jgi:hypothetical protein
MNIIELRDIDSNIKNSYGGVSPWLQRIEDSTSPQEQYFEYIQFLRCVRGGSRSHPCDAHVNINGIDWSHRHAKKRLHNRVNELLRLVRVQADWAIKKTASSANSVQNMDIVQRPFTVAHALQYYYSKVKDGSIHCLEAEDEEYARKRGREWEISLDPNYPPDPFEQDASEAHRHFKTTPEQRAFIEGSTLPFKDENEYIAAPCKEKRGTGKKVTFNPNVAVRSDADIDVLRKQVVAPSNTACKPCFQSQPLSEGPGREEWFYKRTTRYYKPGQWSATKASVAVDTSGWMHLDDPDAWDDYVPELEDEGMGSETAQSDFRAALEASVAFVVVWALLFVCCTIAGTRQVEESS